MTPAEFLMARIAEDEAIARDAERLFSDYTLEGPSAGRFDRFIRRNHPRHVLADCEARRRIVGEYDVFSLAGDAPVPEGRARRERLVLASIAAGLDRAIRCMTTVYADHPDYDPHWATLTHPGASS